MILSGPAFSYEQVTLEHGNVCARNMSVYSKNKGIFVKKRIATSRRCVKIEDT